MFTMAEFRSAPSTRRGCTDQRTTTSSPWFSKHRLWLVAEPPLLLLFLRHRMLIVTGTMPAFAPRQFEFETIPSFIKEERERGGDREIETRYFISLSLYSNVSYYKNRLWIFWTINSCLNSDQNFVTIGYFINWNYKNRLWKFWTINSCLNSDQNSIRKDWKF